MLLVGVFGLVLALVLLCFFISFGMIVFIVYWCFLWLFGIFDFWGVVLCIIACKIFICLVVLCSRLIFLFCCVVAFRRDFFQRTWHKVSVVLCTFGSLYVLLK